MLQLSDRLLNRPVLSLRTGSVVATAITPIINPDNLKIEGFYCQDSRNKAQLILLCQDIREIIKRGYVIDDHDVLAEADELVRLKEVLDINYQIVGKQVVTTSKEKVGKVTDYAVEVGSMTIQKIYVAQSLMKSLTGGSLSVDRSQVNEITPKRIIINELAKKAPATAPIAA